MFCCCGCAFSVIFKGLLKSNPFSVSAVRHCGEMMGWDLLKMGHEFIWSLKNWHFKNTSSVLIKGHRWHFKCNHFPLFRAVLSIVRKYPWPIPSKCHWNHPEIWTSKHPWALWADYLWLSVSDQSTREWLHPFKCPLEIGQPALHMHP